MFWENTEVCAKALGQIWSSRLQVTLWSPYLRDWARVFTREVYVSVNWNPHPPDPGHIGGFDKGPDQIIPKPPAPGENLEIKFQFPGNKLARDWKQQTNKPIKKKPFTLNWSGTKYTLISQYEQKSLLRIIKPVARIWFSHCNRAFLKSDSLENI